MNKIKNEQREAIVRKAIAERDALLSGAQPAPQAGVVESQDQMDAIALARFKVLPTTSGYWGWCIKAGDGEAELYKGHKSDCELVARRMVGAFLDGGHKALGLLAAHPTEQPSQDAEDAARYRHLRNKSEPNREGDKPWCTVRDNKGYAWAFGSALDATVDAARAAQAQGAKGGAP